MVMTTFPCRCLRNTQASAGIFRIRRSSPELRAFSTRAAPRMRGCALLSVAYRPNSSIDDIHPAARCRVLSGRPPQGGPFGVRLYSFLTHQDHQRRFNGDCCYSMMVFAIRMLVVVRYHGNFTHLSDEAQGCQSIHGFICSGAEAVRSNPSATEARRQFPLVLTGAHHTRYEKSNKAYPAKHHVDETGTHALLPKALPMKSMHLSIVTAGRRGQSVKGDL